MDLQGTLKTCCLLTYCSFFTFVNKLKLLKTNLQKKEFTHFPSLLKVSGQTAEVEKGELHGVM